MTIFKLPTSDSGLRTPVSQLPTSDFRLQTSVSGLPTSDFRLQTSVSGLPTPHFRRIRLTAFLLLFTFVSSPAQTLEEYLTVAGENNSELRAYFTDYLVAMEMVSRVGTLPDPELTVGVFLRPMERLMGIQQADIQLMQMFPWFGMLRTQKDEASKMALSRYEIFQDNKIRLFYEVKITWYEMYQLEQQIRITEANLNILKKYERLALIRFQSAGGTSMQIAPLGRNSMNEASGSSAGNTMGNMAGTGSKPVNPRTDDNASMNSTGTPMGSSKSGMSNVLRARMEIKELESNLALLKDSRKPLQAEFNQLLGRNINEAIALPDTLVGSDLSMERLALLDSITQNNPMLKMLDAEVTAFEAQRNLARIEGRPMLGVGLNYMPFRPRTEDGMSMGGDDMIMPMIRLSIPIYRRKYNAMAKEASLKIQAAQQRRANTVNQLSVQWASALKDLDDATRRTDLYRDQTDLARQTLNLVMMSYTTEGLDFEEVLRVQQQLLNYELSLVNAVVDQHTALATLNALAAIELK